MVEPLPDRSQIGHIRAMDVPKRIGPADLTLTLQKRKAFGVVAALHAKLHTPTR